MESHLLSHIIIIKNTCVAFIILELCVSVSAKDMRKKNQKNQTGIVLVYEMPVFIMTIPLIIIANKTEMVYFLLHLYVNN